MSPTDGISRPRYESPFQRTTSLLAGSSPGKPPIDLGVGEPRHPIPPFVGPVLAAHVGDFGRYPPIRGTDAFRKSVADWADRRFGLGGMIDPATMVLPLNGSREGLFHAAIAARRYLDKPTNRPVVLLPNPFYQAYSAGADVAGCEIVTIAPAGTHTAIPDLTPLRGDLLERTVAIYIASPANPQGTTATLDDWLRIFTLARRFRFFVFADECYSELYRTSGMAPTGALEAAKETGSLDLLVSFNSLSKRSNLPGLRVGYAIGDPAFLTEWTKFRNMAAPQVPLPLQAVAAAALEDELHVIENRGLYDQKYAAAEKRIGRWFPNLTPKGGFFLWLDVSSYGDGELVARALWRLQGLRVIPGGYLCTAGPDGVNPGTGFIRLALVDDLDLTITALDRIAEFFGAA